MRLVLALLALAAAAGCGPIQSTPALIDADIEVEAARSAGAVAAAPYEFTSAEAYLRKAREEVGYAQYQAATDFALKSRDLAKEAREKALNASNRPTEAP
ncbi:MAG: DUF4398 domain-containing protein [Anaeromyxobacteraceae bacterium]